MSTLLPQPALAAMAKELGAIVESNLTDTATHLVASDFASEKYKVRHRLASDLYSLLSHLHDIETSFTAC